jgi:hypothetical protein
MKKREGRCGTIETHALALKCIGNKAPSLANDARRQFSISERWPRNTNTTIVKMELAKDRFYNFLYCNCV